MRGVKTVAWLMGLWVVLNGCGGGLTYEGSVPIGSLLIPKAARQFTANTGLVFDAVYTHGSERAFHAVREEHIDLGGVARPLTPEERNQPLTVLQIGYDALAVFVHAANPVSGLSAGQLRDILNGTVVNWSEVGGNDLPIQLVLTETPGRAVTREFLKLIGEPALTDQAARTMLPDEHLQQVIRQEGALTLDSLAFLRPGLKPLAYDGQEPTPANIKQGVYPLRRPLFLIAPAKPSSGARRFLDFIISPEGQKQVQDVFVPVR